MLKRELKINFKMFLVFMLILVLMLILVFAMYPTIMSSNIDIDAMMEMFPKELLSAFNMDIISIESVFGWLVSEGYLFITLLGGIYFGILGGTIVLKEQSDNTINYLYSKPISKSHILTSKIVCGLIYLVVFNIILGITTYFGLQYNNDFDFKNWLLFTIAPVLLELFIFMVSLFISLFLKKTSKGISISIGVIFIMYILSVLSLLTENLEILQYFSIFYYMDSAQIILEGTLKLQNVLITLGLSTLFCGLTYIGYSKKELGK